MDFCRVHSDHVISLPYPNLSRPLSETSILGPSGCTNGAGVGEGGLGEVIGCTRKSSGKVEQHQELKTERTTQLVNNDNN